MGGVRDFLLSIIESKNKTLLAFCFCFILATSIFSIIEITRTSLFYFYILIFVLLFFIIIFFDKKIIRIILLIVLFFILGVCRLLYNAPVVDDNFISFYNGQKQIIYGIISSEPNKKVGWREYILETSFLENKNGIKKQISGKLLFRTPSYPEFFYGDKLKIECELKKPKNTDNFNYQKFLALKNVYTICYPGEIKVIDIKQSSKIMSTIFSFKRKINILTQKLWVEPNNTLVAGILYGERSGFDDELKNDFSKAGITHIIAVSGYNITIIVWILMGVLIWIGLYRRKAVWVCLSLIFLFVIFTGASASAARAGLMGSLLLLAQQLGRKSDIFRLLVYAATLLALINPLILIWDVGFQLSFLATIGLIYLTPILEKRFIKVSSPLIEVKKRNKIKDFVKGLIKEFLIPTLAATIFTFPLISYSFGYFSLLSIIANILVIWLIPFLMLFSFISLILATIFYPLGQVLAWITNLGLSYVIIIGKGIGEFSWASFNYQSPLIVCLVVYGWLLYWIFKENKLEFYVC